MFSEHVLAYSFTLTLPLIHTFLLSFFHDAYIIALNITDNICSHVSAFLFTDNIYSHVSAFLFTDQPRPNHI